MTITAKHLQPPDLLEVAPARTVGPRGSLAVFVTSFIVCLARSTHPGTRFAFWAEDGFIFTQQARTKGVLGSFLTTYNGYLHVLPRTVAAIAAALPLEWSPPIYAVSAMLVASAVATMSFRAAREGLRFGTGESLIVAGTVLLLPSAGADVFGTLTNVEWYLLAGLVVYMVAWFEGWRTNPYLTGVLLFVAATTTPLAGLLLPFVIARVVQQHGSYLLLERRRTGAFRFAEFFKRWSRLDLAVIVGLCAGVGVTLVSHLLAPAGPKGALLNLHRLAGQYAVRVVVQAPLGDRLLQPLYFAIGEHASIVLGAVAGLALVVGAAVSIRRSWSPLLLIVTSVALFMVPAALREMSSVANLGLPPSERLDAVAGGRYFAAPSVALLLAALLLLVRRGNQGSAVRSESLLSRSYRRAMLLLVPVLGAVLVFNVPVAQDRFPLRSWEHSVASARHACARNDRVRVVVPNAPYANFGIYLSCQQAFGNPRG